MADIQNLNEAWNGHTGLEVETFVKQQLRSLLSSVDVKYGYADWDGSSLRFYTEQGGTLLQTLGLSGDIYRITTGYVGPQTFSVLTGDTSTIITINPTTTHQEGIGGTPELFPNDTYDYAVAFNTGNGFVTLLDGQNVSGSVNIDIRTPLIVGTNQVRITITGRTSGAVATLNLTAIVTALTFRCQHNWRLPWNEGLDYVIQGIYFSGAVSKTLHVALDGNEYADLAQTYSSGENASTTARSLTIPSSKFAALNLESSGQHRITLWMTTGNVKTPDVEFNILLVKENETAALVCLNNVADKVMNYSSTHVFDYYTLNADKIDFVITTTTAEGVTSYQTLSNTDLTDGVLNTLSVSVEAPTELDGGSVEIDAIPYAEDVQGIAVSDITFTLDNSLAFIATSGAAFYMNAGVRSNGDFNRESIVDSVTGDAFAGTWTDMTWSSDGWVRDTNGHPSLAIPAGCSVQFPTLIPTSFMHGDSQGGSRTGLTIEMMLRSSVVANLDEPVLEFTQSISVPTTTIPSGTIDVGVIVYPTKILVRGTNEYSKDIVQEVGLCEDTITHLAITFSPNYMGATGKNLCAIYVNGISNVAFAYDTNSTFGNGSLKIGQDSTDVYLYLLRIYGRALAGSEIIQNLKNAIFEGVEFSRQQLDTDNAIYDNGIQYQLAKSKYNCFIIEPDDPTADIPNVNNDKKVQSTIYFEYAGHPEMDTKIAHVPIDGQGTTSMRYFRWNLRGKFTDYKEEGGKITPACEWYYKDSNGQYKETPDFTGKEGFIDGYSDATTNAAGHTKTQRVTMKKNVASSPQGHKMGSTALYDDLFTALGLKNELPDPNFRVAVWQYPFLGFRKSGNDYQFIGLYTGGPDKGCKTTFGYNKKGDYAKCMCIEGPNHNPRGTRFLHPWVNVWYDATAKEETLKFGLAPNAEEAWDDDFSAGYDSDDTNAASNILAMYVSEWKPAYDLVYHCSPYIASLQEAAITLNGVTSLIKDVINSTADADIIAYINSDIETFQGTGQRSNGEKNELMSFYDSNYDIWYYDNTAKAYIKLVRQDGDAQDGLWNIKTYLGLTGSPTTAEIVAARAAKFKAEMGNYFSVNQTLYHKCFCMLIGAKDNDAKNSYPFKHYTFANGGRWGWKQDDLDSIFDTDNNGMATVKYSVEHGDMNGAVEIFQGSDSAFWTLIWRNYQTGETSLQTMMANIMSRLGSMATSLGIAGSFLHESVINVLYHYFFGNSAKYFPVIAYQEDRDFTYITPWLLAGTTKPNGETYPVAYNQVEPLTQALGDRYQDERLWIERRIAYLFSKYSIGAFGDNTAGWGVFEFGLKTQFVFKLTPAIDLYPTGNVGGSSAGRRGARTAAGSEASVSMPSSGTSLYIKCTDWLASLGDLCETEFVNRNTGDEDAVLNISGKRLEEVKVGDALASKVKFNAVGLAVSGAAIKVVNGLNTTTLVNPVNLANCPRLRKALFGGSTASGLLLPSGSRIDEVSFPEMTKDIFLDSQNKLTAAKLTLPQTSVVEGYYFYQCANLNPIAILESINNSRLGYVTMIWNNVIEATSAQVSALKDLADRQCGNVSYENNVITHNEGSPIVSGSIHVDVIDKEMYDAITEAFANLTITYRTMVDFIKFEDPHVAEICAYNWGDVVVGARDLTPDDNVLIGNGDTVVRLDVYAPTHIILAHIGGATNEAVYIQGRNLSRGVFAYSDTYNDRGISQLIDISGYTQIKISQNIGTGYGFFDAEKHGIATDFNMSSTTTWYNIPEGARYFRFMGMASNYNRFNTIVITGKTAGGEESIIYSAHQDSVVPTIQGRIENYRITITAEDSWDLTGISDANNVVAVISRIYSASFGTSNSILNLAGSDVSSAVTKANWENQTTWLKDGNTWSATVQSLDTTSYIGVAIRAAVGQRFHVTIEALSEEHRHPYGITKAQACCPYSFNYRFRANTLITKFNEGKFFEGMGTYAIGSGTTSVFASCTNLKELALNPKMTTMTRTAQGCSSLEKVELPPYITSVANSALSGTNILNNLVFAEGLMTIGTSAFESINNATLSGYIVLPSTITSIGSYAFRNRRSKFLICKAAVPPATPTNYTYTFGNIPKIYVPDNSVSAYKNATGDAAGWANVSSKIFGLSQFIIDFPEDAEELGISAE